MKKIVCAVLAAALACGLCGCAKEESSAQTSVKQISSAQTSSEQTVSEVPETYPIKYQEYVEKYAAENNIDKYLVYAVIKTESDFDPSFESGIGARGLMQITEDTFDWIMYKSGDDKAVYYDMYDEETNIKFGCRLLGYLQEEFSNIECIAAAYHAGRANVNEWLSDKKYSSDGICLDVIPISDTADYVDKITKTRNEYIKLYDNNSN